MGNARVARHPERAVGGGGDTAGHEIERHGPLLLAVSGEPYQPALDRVVPFHSGSAIRTRRAGEQREAPRAERAEAENFSRRSIDGDRARLAVGGGAPEFVERLPFAFLMLFVLSLRGILCLGLDYGRSVQRGVGHFGRLARCIGKPGKDRSGCIGNQRGTVIHGNVLPWALVLLKDPHRLIPAVHSLFIIRSFPTPDSNQKSATSQAENRPPPGDLTC